jgi:SAM-dependent methyltransferase
MDPGDHRAQARERWEAIAGGWAKADAFGRATEPVTDAMIAAIEPRPGQVVLELAAGRGDTGFRAAELIAPGGTLISTVGAEAMVAAARQRAEELGLTEVVFKPMELEWLDQDTASVDAILCRFGYMHALDPEAALREARRALKPDGRIAIAVWDLPERNPAIEIPRQALASTGEGPGAFALSASGAVEELLGAAGFQEIAVSTVPITFGVSSLDEMWDLVMGISSTMAPLARALSPAEHFALRDTVDAGWSPYVQADGTVAVPGSALVASASA